MLFRISTSTIFRIILRHTGLEEKKKKRKLFTLTTLACVVRTNSTRWCKTTMPNTRTMLPLASGQTRARQTHPHRPTGGSGAAEKSRPRRRKHSPGIWCANCGDKRGHGKPSYLHPACRCSPRSSLRSSILPAICSSSATSGTRRGCTGCMGLGIVDCRCKYGGPQLATQ